MNELRYNQKVLARIPVTNPLTGDVSTERKLGKIVAMSESGHIWVEVPSGISVATYQLTQKDIEPR